jgi:hypothetical protein
MNFAPPTSDCTIPASTTESPSAIRPAWVKASASSISLLFGVDTHKRDATASAAVLEALTPFFEAGVFQAPVIDRVIPLSEGCSAYVQVARGETRGRLGLRP